MIIIIKFCLIQFNKKIHNYMPLLTMIYHDKIL